MILPHTADHIYASVLAKSHYRELTDAGVKIYEYTPGFIHAKSFVVDGLYAVVGTINLDYRSLYLHFECATWLYRSSCIGKIEGDFEATQEVSQEVTLEECRNWPCLKRLMQTLLKIFAPLM